jgi:FkbM family methyltransferase
MRSEAWLNMCVRLPNGREIKQLSGAETAVLFREIVSERCWLPRQVALRPGATVLDVGANIGIASLAFADETDNVTVHAFEPIPEAFACLRWKFEHNDVCGAAHNVAVGREAGESAFIYYPRASVMSGLYADAAIDADLTRAYLRNSGFEDDDVEELVAGMHEGVTLHTPVTTVSAIIEEHEIEVVDYLKVDVERAELDVLLGVEEDDWARIRQVGAEIHDEDGRLDGMRDVLTGHGFAVTVRQDPLLAGTCVFDLFGVAT